MAKNCTDTIRYRLPSDPPGIWRHAGTLAQLEAEHQRNQRRANVVMLADAIIASTERDPHPRAVREVL